jgi:hypothetical protein
MKILKKIPFFILIMGLLISLWLPTNNGVQAESNEDSDLKKVTNVNDYVDYLESLIAEDPQAELVLEQFQNLNPNEQRLFIKALNPKNYFKILEQSSMQPNKTITVKLDTGESVKVKNKKVKEELEPVFNTLATTYRVTTPWANSYTEILGITTSKFALRMIYQSNGTSALQVYDVEKEYYNYNPGVWTEEKGFTSPYVSGGYAFGGHQWRLYSTASWGFIHANYDMYLKAKPGTGYYKVNSGHPNLGHDYIKYF